MNVVFTTSVSPLRFCQCKIDPCGSGNLTTLDYSPPFFLLTVLPTRLLCYPEAQRSRSIPEGGGSRLFALYKQNQNQGPSSLCSVGMTSIRVYGDALFPCPPERPQWAEGPCPLCHPEAQRSRSIPEGGGSRLFALYKQNQNQGPSSLCSVGTTSIRVYWDALFPCRPERSEGAEGPCPAFDLKSVKARSEIPLKTEFVSRLSGEPHPTDLG